MSQNYGGYLARGDRDKRGNRKQTEREKKRAILAERRKPLNIEHLQGEKLKDKVNGLWNWFKQLEEEKYDFECRVERQKYDVTQLRQRVNEYMQKSGKAGKGPTKIKTIANVGAKAAAFK